MIEHKRYLLFLTDQWEANGGWSDFELASDQWEELLWHAYSSGRYNYEIIDLEDGETISTGRVRDILPPQAREIDDAQDAD